MARYPDTPACLLETDARSRRFMVPESKKLATNLDGDPAIVRNGHESAVPILRWIILPRQFRLDEMGLMARLVQVADGVIERVGNGLRWLPTHDESEPESLIRTTTIG